MNALRRPAPLLPFAALAAAVLTAEAVASRQVPSAPAPALLVAAIVFDLVVALPVAYWWFFVRGRGPSLRALPAVVLGMLAVQILIPAEHRGILDDLHLLLIAVEVVAAGLVARAAVRALRAERGAADAVDRIRQVVNEAIPVRAAARIVAYEITLLYLSLFSWRSRPHIPAGAVAFSTHRRSGYTGLALAGAGVGLGEALVLHLLIAGWNSAVAWVLTVVSAYGTLWLLADLACVRLRPLLADADALTIRVGLRWEVRIPWNGIASVEPRGGTPFPHREPGHLRATPSGEPTHVIVLRTPRRARGPYGITREVSTIGIAVDDRRHFEAMVRERTA